MTNEYIPQFARENRTFVEDSRVYFKGRGITNILEERGIRTGGSLIDLIEPNGALLIKSSFFRDILKEFRNLSFFHVSEDFNIQKLGDQAFTSWLGRTYRRDGIRVENYIHNEYMDHDNVRVIGHEIIIPKKIIEYETIPSDFGHRYPTKEIKYKKTEEIKFKLPNQKNDR